MTRRSIAVALLACGLALACSDSAGPPLDLAEEAPEATQSGPLTLLSWGPMEGEPGFEAIGDLADQAGIEGLYASPPPLDTYQVRFWVNNNDGGSVQINWYEKSEALGVMRHPYLRFVVPADGLVSGPNGEVYDDDDEVLITLTVDPQAMVAHFSPSGLTFNGAELTYWYTGAGGDFNGDGAINEYDLKIEWNMLGMWRTQDGRSWESLSATQNMDEDWLQADVDHFTGFAVAY